MPFLKRSESQDPPANPWQVEPIRPRQLEMRPPCRAHCPSGIDIRGWIATIAQHGKLGLDQDEAFTRAWRRLVEFNPLPSVLGRICPHSCESHCNRADKDAAVSIHAMERFIGDWALDRQLPLSMAETQARDESIGVIGSGPAGLSFAYQMARRGYPVTVYEQHPKAGGMLRYGIPAYRLPRQVLDREIGRIQDLGVQILLDTRVGRGVPVPELTGRHRALFVGIGAASPRYLRIPGEEGPGVLAGTHFLNRVNQGQGVDPGPRVVVIGGGNTAVDAARAARRLGAEVTLLYRRTRQEMPAIREEVEGAQAEGIDIRLLAAPAEILRSGDAVTAIRVQQMVLGEPDASGRRRPIPVEGEIYEIPASTVIAAVSQQPDWDDLDPLSPSGGKLSVDASGRVADRLWTGGDTLALGTVSAAVGHGRRAAEALHAELRGLAPPRPDEAPIITSKSMHLDYYPACERAEPPVRPVEEWLSRPNEEIRRSLGKQQFLDEASRCLSCGNCFGCEHCWMFCNPTAYSRKTTVAPGAYFIFDSAACEGCGKCIEVCPCGYLSTEG